MNLHDAGLDDLGHNEGSTLVCIVTTQTTQATCKKVARRSDNCEDTSRPRRCIHTH